MNKGWRIAIVALLAIAVVAVISLKSDKSQNQPDRGSIPPKALAIPKLVDLGADKCIPCRQLAPILDELREEKKGKLEVVFIDVWKNPDAGDQYKIQVIPTQIFYDRDGKEFFRHQGFISKEDILAKFQEHGINL